jgi:hypothetical protein
MTRSVFHSLDLELDEHRSGASSCRLDRAIETADRLDMVLLDQNGVEESDPVVAGSAATDGVLLCGPEPRDGLACIEDGHAGAGYGIDVGCRNGGRGR